MDSRVTWWVNGAKRFDKCCMVRYHVEQILANEGETGAWKILHITTEKSRRLMR